MKIKITESKIILFVLIILCILNIFTITKIYKSNSNNSLEGNKTIIFSKVCTEDENKIDIIYQRIFKLDSNGKCISCKIIMNRDLDTLNQIANELISYDIENKYSNVKLKDYTLYVDTNQYNGLSEDQIKNNVYLEFSKIGSENTKYKIYNSLIEL